MATSPSAYTNADNTVTAVTPITPLPVTSSSTQLPATLGQQTMAASLPVVIASNQGVFSVSEDAKGSSGGCVQFKVNSAATTNATSAKTVATRLYGYCLQNNAATWAYLKFYNLNVAPTVGSSTVVSIVGIPPGGTVSYSSSVGVYMSLGVAYSIVLNPIDTDANPLAAANTVTGTIYTA